MDIPVAFANNMTTYPTMEDLGGQWRQMLHGSIVLI